MQRIRVLLVDDSSLMRRVLVTLLASEPDIEVAGMASNGRLALARIAQDRPDVVTLDMDMPEMGGLETLTEIRKLDPMLPVIMFSALTERGAVATIEALTRGASDYVTKPTASSGPEESNAAIRAQLIPKIRQFARRAPEPDASRRVRATGFTSGNSQRFRTPREPVGASPPPAGHPSPVVAGASGRSIQLVAIGISTGGPEALAHVFASLPADLPVPVLVVQHMPAAFTPILAERLGSKAVIAVLHGCDGALLAPRKAWIAPGDYHLTVVSSPDGVRLATNQNPHENSCRPSVDVLFRSIAQVFGSRALGVVMTGMGQDGLRGAEALHRAGARIIVQDEASSIVWGMPGAIARAGLADAVLPLDKIAAEIDRRARVRGGLHVPSREGR